MGEIPAVPGTYALHMRVPQLVRIQIGRLGSFDLPPGGYLYLGSAFGPGGLRARTGRYLLDVRKTHWHIDYIFPVAQIERIFFSASNRPLECLWSQKLASLPQAQQPVYGFGSSDCTSGCKAHLVRLTKTAEAAVQQHLQDVSKPFRVATCEPNTASEVK